MALFKKCTKSKFKDHACELNLGSGSMLPEKTTWFCRGVRKLGQLSELHPLTFDYYPSYPSVVAQRQRLLLAKAVHTIHPLSIFSLLWSSFMIFINLFHMIMSPYRLIYVLNPPEKIYTIDISDDILLCLNIICLLDIVIRLNTGYVYEKTIIMERTWIVYHYMPHWLLFDLASCLPIAYVILLTKCGRRVLFGGLLLPIIRTARLYDVLKDVKTATRVFSSNYIVLGSVRIIVVFIMTSYWCGCLLYVPAVFTYYWTGVMPAQYNAFVGMENGDTILSFNISHRLWSVSIVILSSFFGTGYYIFNTLHPEELILHSFILFYATIFLAIIVSFGIKCYITIYGSSTRYHGLVNQVEQYMGYRQFPTDLKKKVQAFYHYRYQERYSKETSSLNCLSEELYTDIHLHTCHVLVQKVQLFEDIPPAVVGAIVACLKLEVYMCSDLVQRAGDVGDSMYFVGMGTVAVYSSKGVEIEHLEDGAHFGEESIVMRDNKYVRTIVAVEITLLYKLEAADFRQYIQTHELLYERIQTEVSRRIHQLVMLDDEYRHRKEFRDRDSLESKHMEPPLPH